MSDGIFPIGGFPGIGMKGSVFPFTLIPKTKSFFVEIDESGVSIDVNCLYCNSHFYEKDLNLSHIRLDRKYKFEIFRHPQTPQYGVFTFNEDSALIFYSFSEAERFLNVVAWILAKNDCIPEKMWKDFYIQAICGYLILNFDGVETVNTDVFFRGRMILSFCQKLLNNKDKRRLFAVVYSPYGEEIGRKMISQDYSSGDLVTPQKLEKINKLIVDILDD